jgi:multidrug efflux pump subunit AcrA (membrane-fusion protein)
MNSLLQSIGARTKALALSFWQLPVRTRVIVLIAIFSAPVAISLLGADKIAVVPDDGAKRQVSLQSVAALSENSLPLALFGVVTSKSEATIRAETGGKIVAVYKKLGDFASAGTVIAEFENSRERAQVQSAEGAYESASLGKDIAGITRNSSDNALAEARTQAQNTIMTVYTGLDDAVRTKTDPAWRNPQTRDARLIVTISDAKLVIELEAERTLIETTLRAREERNRAIGGASDLIAELTAIESEVNLVKNYLDDLSLAFNRALPDNGVSLSAIDGYKSATAGARTSVGGLLTQVATSRNALNSALSANKIAGKNSSDGVAQSPSATDAQVKSALGNLRSAQSTFEKTIIRSPISGTINSLAIETGDFISPYSEVAVVSNNAALEVLAYVTEEDAREIVVGGKASIEGGVSGVVTRIAPALDPKTKKIELRIGISGGMKLINGQSVRIEVARMQAKVFTGDIRIPLSALKITPNGIVAFTVSEAGTLVAHGLKEGALLGDQIIIREGLTPDMTIVTDARGLQEGMFVTIK